MISDRLKFLFSVLCSLFLLLYGVLYHKYTGYEFNLGAKICISSANSVLESGMDRAVRLALEMLIPNANEMTMLQKRKMRVAEQFSR